MDACIPNDIQALPTSLAEHAKHLFVKEMGKYPTNDVVSYDADTHCLKSKSKIISTIGTRVNIYACQTYIV